MADQDFADIVKGVFHWGSRFHAEKIGVLVGFVVLSVGSAIWAFSTPGGADGLGAEVTLDEGMVGFELLIENDGDTDWSDVRITLDRQYLYTTEEIESGGFVQLTRSDLEYAYHIPRPWGREEWERLAADKKPGVEPPDDYVPSFVQIRAWEGELDEDL